MTARYKYPIVDGNVALDMIALSGNVAKVLAAGPAALMLKSGQGYKKRPKALMDKMLELMDKVEQLKLEDSNKEAKKVKFPFPAHPALELKKMPSDPALPKVSTDEQYNPNLTSGSEADDEFGDFVKRSKVMAKEMAKKRKSPAQSSTGSGFIKGQTLKPISEKYVIGSAAPLPSNDLSNDSFLIKPTPYEPVI